MRTPDMNDCKKMPSTRFQNTAYTMQIRRHVIENDPDFFTFLSHETNSTLWNLDNIGADLVVVDHVVRCYGWVMDKTIFDHDTIAMHLQTSHKDKYPVIHDTYEADGVPGLFFAGSLAHS